MYQRVSMDQEFQTKISTPPNKQWWALHCKPNREGGVWNQLRERRIQCYFPRLNVRPVNPRSRSERPYFPGYLFVCGPLAELYTQRVGLLAGAVGLVAFDGQPAPISQPLIEVIQAQVAQANQQAAHPAGALQPGERVRVENTPFGELSAVFERCLNGDERVLVLMEVLSGRPVRLEVPARDVYPLKTGRQPA
jgi:transcription antitermination factor NusG